MESSSWAMACGILLVGFVVFAIRGFNTAGFADNGFAMLGGAIWATGNLACPMIIQRIGMGLGLLVWGMVNMLTGWATGHFGLCPGIPKETVEYPLLNWIGLAGTIVALLFFTQVDSSAPADGETASARDLALDLEKERGATTAPPGPSAEVTTGSGPPPGPGARSITNEGGQTPLVASDSAIDREVSSDQWLLGFVLALIAGVFFGSNFDPPTILEQRAKKDREARKASGMSEDALDYVFAHFCGILAATTLYFGIYALAMGRRRDVRREVFIPAMLCGVCGVLPSLLGLWRISTWATWWLSRLSRRCPGSLVLLGA